jgi:hypothetical protein
MPIVSNEDPNNPENVEEREKWHKERRLSDLERELLGAETRGDKDYAKNVRDELSRLGAGGQRTAAKRPRTAAKKETR